MPISSTERNNGLLVTTLLWDIRQRLKLLSPPINYIYQAGQTRPIWARELYTCGDAPISDL
eukprot:5504969-Pleurochrysis_carterae.AAC.3